MTIIQRKLINAYAVLVMAKRMDLGDIPDREVTLDNGIKSTIRAEVEIEVAERTITLLT